VVAQFIGCDLGVSLVAIDEYLDGIEKVRHGEFETWRMSGNSFRLVVKAEGCHLQQYDPEPRPGVLGAVDLSPDVLVSVLLAWKAHVLASGCKEGGNAVCLPQ
jgi:hypothetical protein